MQARFRNWKAQRRFALRKSQLESVAADAKSKAINTIQKNATKAWKKFKIVSKVMKASKKLQLVKKIQRAYRKYRLYKPSKIKTAVADACVKLDLSAMKMERDKLKEQLRKMQWTMFNKHFKVERLPNLVYSGKAARLRNYGVGHLVEADLVRADESRRRRLRRSSVGTLAKMHADVVERLRAQKIRVFARLPEEEVYYRATFVKFSEGTFPVDKMSRMVVKFDMMNSVKVRKKIAAKKTRSTTENKQDVSKEVDVQLLTGDEEKKTETFDVDGNGSAYTEVRAGGVLAVKKGDFVEAKHPVNGITHECQLLGEAVEEDIKRYQKEKRAPVLEPSKEPLWYFVRFASDRMRYIVPFSHMNLISQRAAEYTPAIRLMFNDSRSALAKHNAAIDNKLDSKIKKMKADLMELTNEKLGRLSSTIGTMGMHSSLTRKHKPLRLYAKNWREAWLNAVGKANWDVTALEIQYVEGKDAPYQRKVKHTFRNVVAYNRFDVRTNAKRVRSAGGQDHRRNEPAVNVFLREEDEQHFTNKIVYRGLATPNCLHLPAKTELEYAALTHLTDEDRLQVLAQTAQRQDFPYGKETKYINGATTTWASQLLVRNMFGRDFCSIPDEGNFQQVGFKVGVKIKDRDLQTADRAGDVVVHVDAGTFRVVKIRESKKALLSDDERKKQNINEDELKMWRFVWEQKHRIVCTNIALAKDEFSRLGESEKNKWRTSWKK